MFYELNSQDIFGGTPWKRSTTGNLNSTFQGELDMFGLITLELNPTAQLSQQAGNQSQANAELNAVSRPNIEIIPGMIEVDVPIPNLLPDG